MALAALVLVKRRGDDDELVPDFIARSDVYQFDVDDIVRWKGHLYKVLEADLLFGKVIDQFGTKAHCFFWRMGGSSAVKVDPSLWNLKTRRKVA